MTKTESLNLLNDLNKVIEESSKIFKAIKANNSIDQLKAIKNCMLGTVKLASVMKKIIDAIVEDDYNPRANPFGEGDSAVDDLKDMFGMNK